MIAVSVGAKEVDLGAEWVKRSIFPLLLGGGGVPMQRAVWSIIQYGAATMTDGPEYSCHQ